MSPSFNPSPNMRSKLQRRRGFRRRADLPFRLPPLSFEELQIRFEPVDMEFIALGEPWIGVYADEFVRFSLVDEFVRCSLLVPPDVSYIDMTMRSDPPAPSSIRSPSLYSRDSLELGLSQTPANSIGTRVPSSSSCSQATRSPLYAEDSGLSIPAATPSSEDLPEVRPLNIKRTTSTPPFSCNPSGIAYRASYAAPSSVEFSEVKYLPPFRKSLEDLAHAYSRSVAPPRPIRRRPTPASTPIPSRTATPTPLSRRRCAVPDRTSPPSCTDPLLKRRLSAQVQGLEDGSIQVSTAMRSSSYLACRVDLGSNSNTSAESLHAEMTHAKKATYPWKKDTSPADVKQDIIDHNN